jgi:hypothetical protein
VFKKLNVYRRLLSYLKPYWPQLLLAYLSMLFASLLNLFVPQIIKRAIDQGLAAGEPIALFIAGGLILGIALIRGAAGFGQRYFGEWAKLTFYLPRPGPNGRPDESRHGRHYRNRTLRRDRIDGLGRDPPAVAGGYHRYAVRKYGPGCFGPAANAGARPGYDSLWQRGSTDVQKPAGTYGRLGHHYARKLNRH